MYDAQEKAVFTLIVLVIVGFICIIVGGMLDDKSRTEDYQVSCKRLAGEPVWNGKYWECLK